MKKINFIETVSIDDQTKLKQWKQYSGTLIAIIIVTLASFELYQLMQLYSLKKAHGALLKKMDKELKHLQQCQTMQEQIEELKKKIASSSNVSKNPLDMLEPLRTSKNILVEKCTIQNNSCELHLICPNKTIEKNIIKLLEQSTIIKNCNLVSIAQKTKENQLLVFKAEIQPT